MAKPLMAFMLKAKGGTVLQAQQAVPVIRLGQEAPVKEAEMLQ